MRRPLPTATRSGWWQDGKSVHQHRFDVEAQAFIALHVDFAGEIHALLRIVQMILLPFAVATRYITL